MRCLILTWIGLIAATAMQTRAMEWNVYRLNENPVPTLALASFSIGYPRGWKANQVNDERGDIYFDTVIQPVNPTTMICSFCPTNIMNQANWASIVIFLSGNKMAKLEKNLSPIKTSAGNSGCLREYQTGQEVSQDFFFHCGQKGAIRIEIVTRAADKNLRSELDHLVLQTLRFGDS
jgi:hypothetical protein